VCVIPSVESTNFANILDKKIGRKNGNAKKNGRSKERNQEKCGFSIAISTNFAKILENVAQISDIQNWEKKKGDVLGNENVG